MRWFLIIAFHFSSVFLFAQKPEYAVALIPDSLMHNANAVIRLYQVDITIPSQRTMAVKNKRIVTIFNEKGLDAINAVEHYDKRTSVKNIEATVFDAVGKEIKRIRRKEFRDQCVLDGITLFSDSRIIFLHYTPTQYPFTIAFESETTTSNTAFIPSWQPLNDYLTSLEKSVLTVTYASSLGFKKKEFNLSRFDIRETATGATGISYTANHIPAQRYEAYSPAADVVFPKIMMGLEVFNLEGVDGAAKDWKEFGQWYSNQILAGTTALPKETKLKMKALVGDEKDPVEKAKIIYSYVQEKSRYVSIQVGIGGWKPMLASDVDRLGYGDCKALSNYTKALLDAVDVPSYNVVVFGGWEKRSIESDFVSMQGNHMMLSVPNGKDYVWLECTSPNGPFGYQGTGTDDRDVLIIKPDGGEIVRTSIYKDRINSQVSKGSYKISENGDLSGNLDIESQGVQYDGKFNLESKSPTDNESHYKEYWDNIGNLKIKQLTFVNDKKNVRFNEKIDLSAANYAQKSGHTMLFAVNAFNPYKQNVKKIKKRKTPFEIPRGFYNTDEIEVILPDGFSVESLPQNTDLAAKYGDYKTEYIKVGDKNIIYKRSLLIKSGIYPNTEYEDYRVFIDKISRNDNAKIVLTKNQ